MSRLTVSPGTWLLEKRENPVLILFPDTNDITQQSHAICFTQFTDYNEYAKYCDIIYNMNKTREFDPEKWEIVTNKVAGEYIANG